MKKRKEVIKGLVPVDSDPVLTRLFTRVNDRCIIQSVQSVVRSILFTAKLEWWEG